MLKIENRTSFPQIITATAKCLFFGLFLLLVTGFHSKKHPFYISVVDIKHNAKQHSLNVSVKLFTNDIEDALKKTTSKPIDLLNPKNKAEMETELMNYIKKRLSLSVNAKMVNLDFIGYEKEEDAIWTYFEVKKVVQPKIIKIETKLLFDFLPQQTNIVHAEINGVKKSSKVVNPDSKIEFKF
ncbi:MAG: DUF6702 family protein [Bacteroidota bacterium]